MGDAWGKHRPHGGRSRTSVCLPRYESTVELQQALSASCPAFAGKCHGGKEMYVPRRIVCAVGSTKRDGANNFNSLGYFCPLGGLGRGRFVRAYRGFGGRFRLIGGLYSTYGTKNAQFDTLG